jgi:hypothetical protein
MRTLGATTRITRFALRYFRRANWSGESERATKQIVTCFAGARARPSRPQRSAFSVAFMAQLKLSRRTRRLAGSVMRIIGFQIVDGVYRQSGGSRINADERVIVRA